MTAAPMVFAKGLFFPSWSITALKMSEYCGSVLDANLGPQFQSFLMELAKKLIF